MQHVYINENFREGRAVCCYPTQPPKRVRERGGGGGQCGFLLLVNLHVFALTGLLGGPFQGQVPFT